MVSLHDIEKIFKQRNWWDLLFNLRISKYIIYYVANHTELTPNQVTMISFVLAIFSGIAFYEHAFVVGALLFQLSYIFDIVDGALARVKGISTRYGAFLDVFTDWLKAPVLIIIVLYLQEEISLLIITLLLLMWSCCANKYNDMLFYTEKKSLTQSDEISTSRIGQYFKYMKERHIIELPGTIEFEALILFFYPITEQSIFLYLALFLLFGTFLLKVYIIMKKLK